MAFENIPLELRQCTQWQNWRYKTLENGRETKVPINPHNGYDGSTINPATWSSFEHACYNAGHYNVGIGLVFTKAFGKSGIDCDNFNLNNPWHARLFEQCQTYAEYSPSGKGVHFICNGIIPSGVNNRANDMELYCEGRFFTFTGNVLPSHNLPITDQQTLLLELYERLASHAAEIVVNSQAETLSDDDVIKRAYAADNGSKFGWLFEGKGLIEGTWQSSGEFPSQSEADQALVNILQFYAPNAEQIKRLFLRSGLATTLARKPKQDYYLGLTIKKSFDRAVPLIQFTGLAEGDPRQKLNGHASAFPPAEPIDPPDVSHDPFLEPLPGVVGMIQQFVLAASPRPLPACATAAALAFVAGIVGRAYNVHRTGLNLYILALAPTGTGKDGMKSSLDRLQAALIHNNVQAIKETRGASQIMSMSGLLKMVRAQPCCLSIIPEFGLRMKRISNPNTSNQEDARLNSALLDLYLRSGAGQTTDGMKYSDAKNDVEKVESPAFSILGDSTAESFFDGTDDSIATYGLLPRFEVIEHVNDIVPYNEDAIYAEPSAELVEKASAMAIKAFTLQTGAGWLPLNVAFAPDATVLNRKFLDYADGKQVGQPGLIRSLWSRAHFRAMRLAAVVAVGCDPFLPTITLDILTWAQKAVVWQILNLLRHLNAGDMDGSGTRKAERQMADAIFRYYNSNFDMLKGFKVRKDFFDAGLIDQSYIYRAVGNRIEFKRDNRVFKAVLSSFVEHGVLSQVERNNTKIREKLNNTTANLYGNLDMQELRKFTSDGVK